MENEKLPDNGNFVRKHLIRPIRFFFRKYVVYPDMKTADKITQSSTNNLKVAIYTLIPPLSMYMLYATTFHKGKQ